MPYSRSPIPHRSRHYLIFATLIIAALVAGIILYANNRLPFWHRANNQSTRATASSNTKGESKKAGSSGEQPPDLGKNNNQAQNVPLMAPIGNFVSSHHPHLSNNPLGSDFITSVCTTTPGATCQILFTMGSITKSLPAETTDAGGSAYWNSWRLQDYGITQGAWTIQARSTLGNQIQTTNDALSLEVTQ